MLLVVLQRGKKARSHRQARNISSVVSRRLAIGRLRRASVLGFNLNNLAYLFVATFKSTGGRNLL